MKKLFLVIALALIAVSGVYAQIYVDSNGKVGVKISSPSYTFDVNGTSRINCSNSSYSLIFDNNQIISGYYFPTIRPSADWYGSLGTSSYRFGLIYSDHVIARDLEETSDERVKENIKTLDNSLTKIVKLRGVVYDLKPGYFTVEDEKLKEKLEKEGKNQIGFLAQELKEVFPEAVHYDSISDLYSISYTRIVPVLVEAMKEQQQQIEALQKQVNDLTEKSDKN